jgi:nucleolar protein 56
MRNLLIVESAIGVFAFDQDNQIVDKALYPMDHQQAADRILKVEAGTLVDEVNSLIERLRGKCDQFILENSRLADNLANQGINVTVEKPSSGGEFLRSNLAQIATNVEFVKKPEDFYSFLREVTTILTKKRVGEAAAKRDKVVIQLITALDEIDKTLNLLAGRISEWYGLHFPELSRVIDSHETYSKIITKFGAREDFTEEELVKAGIGQAKADMIVNLAKNSMGAPIVKEDLQSLQTFCNLHLETAKVRSKLADAIDSLMGTVAPNMKVLVGPNLGGRIIALGGGLERLAKLPASTFQVLGAEKALFRSLSTGTSPPKHGVIFQHQLIHQSPMWQRGKIARALAGKLAIAARIDGFNGPNLGAKLKAELENRVDEIRANYKVAPIRKKPMNVEKRHKMGKRGLRKGRQKGRKR